MSPFVAATVLGAALYRGARAVATFDEQLAARAADRGLKVVGATAI